MFVLSKLSEDVIQLVLRALKIHNIISGKNRILEKFKEVIIIEKKFSLPFD